MTDLAVVGPDPRFGGGSAAHTRAFLDAAAALGREAELLYVPHPGLDAGRARVSLDRVEALRLVRGSRRLVPRVRAAAGCWVSGPLATHGYAAALARRPYRCWVGTTLADENRGRLPDLDPARRLAAQLNAPALRRLERAVLRGADRLFATGDWSRRTVAEAAGLDEAAVGVLPLPVDVDAFAPEPDDVWLARLDAPVLAFVGRAGDPRKNVRLLLDAARLLPDVRVRLIGEPPPGPVPARVEATGTVASVADHLRTASLCVVPSRQEGFGIAAAEALAAGVPVVATPSGGPEALVERSGGGRVLAGWSPEELAAACRELLEDAATLAALRRSGREYVVREHSPDRLRERLSEQLD